MGEHCNMNIFIGQGGDRLIIDCFGGYDRRPIFPIRGLGTPQFISVWGMVNNIVIEFKNTERSVKEKGYTAQERKTRLDFPVLNTICPLYSHEVIFTFDVQIRKIGGNIKSYQVEDFPFIDSILNSFDIKVIEAYGTDEKTMIQSPLISSVVDRFVYWNTRFRMWCVRPEFKKFPRKRK